MKKFLSSALVLCLLIGTIAGCSSAAPTAAPAAPATPAAPAAPAAPAKPAAPAAPAAKTYTIKGAHANAPTHPYHIGMTKFAELLKAKSNGQIICDVFHSSQLGNERDLVEGMQMDTVQTSCITSGPLSGFTDAYLIFDLPFLFPDVTKARMVCDSPIGDEMLKSLEATGIKGLAFMENGMRNITNSKRAINKPEDLKGIKIRTMENPMHMEAFKVMGADPTPMAFSELFTAMQQKAMDAEENPLVVIFANNFFEVQKYLTITGHLYSPAPLLMSKKFYDSISPELQKVVQAAGDEATAFQRKTCDEQTATLMKGLADKGMIINTPALAPFVEATKPVYTKFVGTGKGLVSPAIYDAVSKLLK